MLPGFLEEVRGGVGRIREVFQQKQLQDCSTSFTGPEQLDKTDGNTARTKQSELFRAHWAQQTLRIWGSYHQCGREEDLTLIE